MAIDQESFNSKLYDLLKVRGYKPVPLNAKNQRVDASQLADVIEFTFVKDGKEYGKAWASIDDAQAVNVYYDDDQADSPPGKTPGLEYDDSWTGFLKHLKNWAQRKQLSFELADKDRLGDDMRHREYNKMQEKISESYYPMGKKASYSDAVPSVKIVIEHTRQIEEGEQRYRNINRIFLENESGERFLLDTKKPGIARVYARHIAEGGVPNDDRWNHVKGLCEEYSKMAGFARAVRNGQFNESAQRLVNEGINHYQSLRETLSRMTGHRGYTSYFESWTPALMEDDSDDSTLNELFVQETLDPRIESVMPILSRLRKNIGEMKEVSELAEWADSVVDEGTNGPDKSTVPAYLRKAKAAGSEDKDDWKMSTKDLEDELTASPTSSAGLAALKKRTGISEEPASAAAPVKDKLAKFKALLKHPKLSKNDIKDVQTAIDRLEQRPNSIMGGETAAEKAEKEVNDRTSKTTYRHDGPSADDVFKIGKLAVGLSEGVMSEADSIIQDVIEGNADAYDIMNHPKNPAEQYVAKILQDMYDDVSIDSAGSLHADDDFEQILDIVIDRLSQDYGRPEGDLDEGNPQHSHQYDTTMKHADNPTVQQRMAAHDIKPGIKGYQDRIDMLKDLERTGKLKEDSQAAGDEDLARILTIMNHRR